MADLRELESLWAELFGEPPSIRAETDVLARVLVSALPPAPPYQIAPASELRPAVGGHVAEPGDTG